LRPAPHASRAKCKGARGTPLGMTALVYQIRLLNVGAGFSLLPDGDRSRTEVPAADRQFHVRDAVGCGSGIFDVDFAGFAGQQGNVVVTVIRGENARAAVSIYESELVGEGRVLAAIGDADVDVHRISCAAPHGIEPKRAAGKAIQGAIGRILRTKPIQILRE